MAELQAILLDTKLDGKLSKEFVSPHSTLSKLVSDVKFGTIGGLLKWPVIGPYLNKKLTTAAGGSGGNRPYTLSCKASYTSYESLTDYSYYGRHMEPASDEYVESLPPIETVLEEIFKRKQVKNDKGEVIGEQQTMDERSTMLFPTFAQHLIDSFISTSYNKDKKSGPTEFNFRKTDSPHDIGLLTVYGKTIAQTKQLRVSNPPKGQYGRLKTQMINGEEWAPFLFDSKGKVKEEFSELEYPQGIDHVLAYTSPESASAKKASIFAFGGPRTNLTPNISAWNVLLIREHNRLAGEIEKDEPTWDDERVFQTARNVLLVIYLKLIVEEYINHITKYEVDFTVDPGPWMWHAPWYKRNWISAEFAVLYRWHGVIPSCMKWGDETVSTQSSLFNNNLLLKNLKGNLVDIFANVSNHRATGMNPFNTEHWMVGRDKAALTQCRQCKLKPFVKYAEYMGNPRPKTFSDISKDPEIQAALKKTYGTVDKIEFWTGLIACDNPTENIMSAELTAFVANDAFNQALTHPLLSENVWKDRANVFGEYGLTQVEKKTTIAQILARNTKDGESIKQFIGMTNPNARRRGIDATPLIIIGLLVLISQIFLD